MMADPVSRLRIHLLNHASVLLEMGAVRLLTDPWYSGQVFACGWGLRWENPKALQTAATATHLWISHPHPDHMHLPTLERLAALNPDIVAIGNRAYNYDMAALLAKAGFRRQLVLAEQTPLSLSGDLTIERIGAGALDSALVMHWRQLRIVNLNDCVFQKNALKNLARRLGRIELLLCNFNHAGKLIHYPEKPPQTVRDDLKAHFSAQIAALSPRLVLPFASFHHYLAPQSAGQNHSLLEPNELATDECGSRLVVLYPGQSAEILPGSTHPPAIDGNLPEPADLPSLNHTSPDTTLSAETLDKGSQRIMRSFGIFRFLLPSLVLRLSDSGQQLFFTRGRLRFCESQRQADVESTTSQVSNWLLSVHGSEQWVIGAHLRILRPCIGRLKWLIAMLILAEAEITPRQLLRPSLWRFLFMRRDQVLAYVLSWRVSSSYQ